MNFIAICLHCLDMRDFHSQMRETPFLDRLRGESVFVPMGRRAGTSPGGLAERRADRSLDRQVLQFEADGERLYAP